MTPGPPQHLGREAYLSAGFELLAARGASSLTISALCKRLHASRGSFYHYFPDLPTFNDDLVQSWEGTMRRHLDRLAAITEWRRLLDAAPPEASWRPLVEQGIEALSQPATR